MTDKTTFYAEIQNEESPQEKLVTYSNENKEANNNKKEDNNKNIISGNDFELNDFGYDKVIIQTEVKKEENQKNNFFSNFFSKLFSKKNQIIKKKSFKYKSPKREKNYDDGLCYACAPMTISANRCYDALEIDSDYLIEDFDGTRKDKEEKPKIIKRQLNFDEMILTQDIFEGNWDNNEEVKILIEEEKDIYEKIKIYSESKGVKEENGYITILVIYYIFTKKSQKVEELKFVINKAKAYIKKMYGIEYEEISKEIQK